MKCDLCGKDAVTLIRYNGTHLCGEHFIRFTERRVKKEIRRQADLRTGGVIGVAVSGGKDSMVTLHLMNKVFSDRRDVEIHCITVDEGIGGYRPPSVRIARRYCEENSIPFHLIRFEDVFGLTMDVAAPLSGESSPCTYCGVFRRKCMNSVAESIGAKYLATGHNLDDMAQSILMDFARGDVERLARLGPHKRVIPGLIPRIAPLRMIPENESLLYAIVAEIPFHDGTCPYWEEALRNQYRDVVDSLEDRSPGTRFSIVSSYDTLYPALSGMFPPAEMGRCACGEPTLGRECKACQLSRVIRERASGGSGRSIRS